MASFILLLWIASVGSDRAAAQTPVQTASITVKDANGRPVEGAIACIGTVIHGGAYGQAATNRSGIAYFKTPLPEGPATIYFTAVKDGRAAQVVRSYALPAAPLLLTGHIQLPSAPGGTPCPHPVPARSTTPFDSTRHVQEPHANQNSQVP